MMVLQLCDYSVIIVQSYWGPYIIGSVLSLWCTISAATSRSSTSRDKVCISCTYRYICKCSACAHSQPLGVPGCILLIVVVVFDHAMVAKISSMCTSFRSMWGAEAASPSKSVNHEVNLVDPNKMPKRRLYGLICEERRAIRAYIDDVRDKQRRGWKASILLYNEKVIRGVVTVPRAGGAKYERVGQGVRPNRD